MFNHGNQNRQFGIKQRLANTCIKWSPHSSNILAVGSSQNFGVVGRGLIHVKKIQQNGNIATLNTMNQNDAIFDVSWYQLNDQMILIGSGSGYASFWNINEGVKWAIDLKGQVLSVQCAFKNPLFIAGCNNGILHIGDCHQGKTIFQIPSHIKNCNQVKWHPSSQKIFATCGGDGLLKMWDHTLAKPNISTVLAHSSEILSIDFNKYQQKIVTSSTDNSIRIWDLRNMSTPMNILKHHKYPAKKVRFSPHSPWLLASGGFDMNVHFYDLREIHQPLKIKGSQHTQFVTGVQFNLFDQNLVCSIGWDGRTIIWDWQLPQPIIS